jgi:hypothetical protein
MWPRHVSTFFKPLRWFIMDVLTRRCRFRRGAGVPARVRQLVASSGPAAGLTSPHRGRTWKAAFPCATCRVFSPWNGQDMVLQPGAAQALEAGWINGWLVKPCLLAVGYCLLAHCLWRGPDGRLWEVTPFPGEDTAGWRFLPDRAARFDHGGRCFPTATRFCPGTHPRVRQWAEWMARGETGGRSRGGLLVPQGPGDLRAGTMTPAPRGCGLRP